MSRIVVVPYDRAKHEGFAVASWCRGAHLSRAELLRHLSRVETRAAVACVEGDEDQLAGWAAVTEYGEVVWAHVRDMHLLRRKGIATGMLLALGVDVAKPTACLYWSDDAASIARERGDVYRLYYAPREMRRERAVA